MIMDFLATGELSRLSASDLQRWVALTRMRSGPHLFPSTWPLGCWVGAAGVLAAGARSFLAKRPWNQRDRMALVFAVVVLALWVPATVFSEVVPVRQVILAGLFRSTKLAFLLGLVYFAHHERTRFAGPAREVAVGVLALAAFLALRLDARLIVVFALGAAHFLPVSDVGGRRLLSKAPVLAALGVLVLAFVGAVGLQCSDRARGGLPWWGGVSPAWRDVQVWCREHTPRDAVLLTPPSLQGFRCFSERAIVGDYKDGAPHMYNPPSFLEWWRRMEEMEVEPHGWSCSDSAFQQFSEEKMAWLCREYGATYAVVRSEHSLSWRRLYDNGTYAVYEPPG